MILGKNASIGSMFCAKAGWVAKTVLVSVVSFNLIALPAIANAQTIPDTGIAPSTPTMDQAANGVPVVNIATPSGKGVSHNRFQELNINAEGLIFNNSKTFGTSQLGGVVLANPNLKNTPTASIILNEVTGANTSQLRGFAEIFGDRAQFILANPNGITCNGCGFINTSRTTLTTGTPNIENGDLTGLDVDGSAILTIQGNGLNADDATALDLLARTIRFNAPVNAQDLKVFAGRNLMDYGARIVTPKADDGSAKPALAIDGSHFGAMYANKISVLATEQGVGVRMPDNMATGLGDITITADGEIALKKASAAGNIQVSSSNNDVTINDTVNSGANLSVAGLNVTNNGKLVAGLSQDGTVAAEASLNVSTSQSLLNNGQILASSAMTLESTAGSIRNADTGSIRSQGTINATAASSIDNSGSIYSVGASTLGANKITNKNTVDNPAILKSDTLLTLNTDVLDNSNGNIVSKTKTVITGKTAGVTLDIDGSKITSDGDVEITAEAVDNKVDIEAQANIAITAETGNLSQSGKLQAGNTATLTASNGSLINSASIKAVGDVNVSGLSINNTVNGIVDSGNDITVNATTQVENAGTFSAQNNLTIQSDILENDEGALLAVGDLVLANIGDTAATRIANRSGVIETLNGDISINAVDFINERKNFSVSRQQTYSKWESTVVPVSSVAGGISTQYLEYNAANTLFFRHPDDSSWLLYYDYGPILVRQYQDVATSTNAAAYLSSGGTLTVNADNLRNAYSHISSAGDMTLSGGTLENVGQILTKQTTIYKSGGQYDRCQSNKGCEWLLNGAGERQLSSVAYDSIEGTIQAGGQLLGSFTGQIDNKTILGSVAEGDLLTTNTVLADIKEAPPLTNISLIDFFETLPAKDTLTQLAPSDAKAVFETRTEFANPSVVLGGDYFLSRVDIDIDKIPDRFAFNQALEERVVQNAIRLETGKRWLDPSVQDASLQLKYLIDNGIDAQDNLNLTVGVELTPEQIGQLNQDIIWYVEETINGERVLAPKLYLASANSVEFAQNGGLIVASNVELNGANINNSGDIIATNGSVDLTADEDININSGRVGASDDINLKAGGAILVETDTTNVRTANGGSQSIVGRRASLDAGGSVNLDAAEEIALFGTDVTAEDDVSFSAGSSLIVGATAVEENVNWGDGATYDRWSRTTNRGSNIQAGGDITSVSVNDTIVQGSELSAGEDINLLAGGNVAILAARDTYDYEMQRNGGEKSGTGHSVSNVRSELTSGGDIKVTSLTGDITAQAAKFSSLKEDDGTVTLNAEQGNISLISATDEESWTFKSSKSNAVSFKMRDAGAIDTNVVMTEVTADGGLIVNAGNGVVIEYRDTGNLEDSVAALAATPGLEWMGDMMARDDVTWNAVQEVHKSWDYKAQGLSGPAAAVIAIAVTAATYGGAAAAGGAFATNLGMTATVNGVTTLTASGLAVQSAIAAGLSSLASQAAVSLIGNGGDIGAVLEQLGSSSTIRSLVTSMVTAGLLSGVGSVDIGEAFGNGALNDLATDVLNNSIRSTISSSINTTINGGDLGDSLKNSLRSAIAMSIGSTLAAEIGAEYKEMITNPDGTSDVDPGSWVWHKVAHAALGCARGAISQSGGCAAGAAGGVGGAVSAELYEWMTKESTLTEIQGMADLKEGDPLTTEQQELFETWRQTGVDIGRIAGAASAALLAAESDEVYVGADSGETVARDNVLPAIILMVKGAMVAWTAYELYETAQSAYDAIQALQNGDLTEDQLYEAAALLGIDIAAEVAIDLTLGKLKVLERGYELIKKAGLGDEADDIAQQIASHKNGGGSGTLTPIDSPIDLTSGRSGHILANHRAGTGKAGKTEFPSNWSDERIIHQVSDIVSDPSLTRQIDNRGTPFVEGVRDGIKIRVTFFPDNHVRAGEIASAYPPDLPPNPRP